LLSLQRFQTVLNGTECLFARTAKLWGSCAWVETMTLEENVSRNVEAFAASVRHARQAMDELHDLLLPSKTLPWEDLGVFAEKMKQVRKFASGGLPRPATCLQRVCKRDQGIFRAAELFLDRVDGFVLEIPGEHYSHDLRALSQTVYRVLSGLSRQDFKPRGEPFASGSPSSSWFFSFDGEPVTLTSFAPFYPITNSRHQFCNDFNRDCCYLLFQPESAFHFLESGPGRTKSQMDWEHPISAREKIRCLYRKHGREYDVANEDDGALPSSESIVRPLYLNQRSIKWWLPDPFASTA